MRYFLVFLLPVSLVSCGSEPAPPKSQRVSRPAARKVEKKPEKPKEEELVVEKVERPAYNPEGRRDPFRPFIARATVKKRREPLTPLERYSLSQLRLVAIVWGVDGAVAMVEDPEGKGYSIRVGTPIGNRNGRVKEILKDRVIVEERFLDAFGRQQKEEVVLELPREEEGLSP